MRKKKNFIVFLFSGLFFLSLSFFSDPFLSRIIAPVIPPGIIHCYIDNIARYPLEDFQSKLQFNSDVESKIHPADNSVIFNNISEKKPCDILITSSPDYYYPLMEKGLIDISSRSTPVYLLPALIIKKRNPTRISRIQDILEKNVRLALVEKNSCDLGAFSLEILEENGISFQDVKDKTVLCRDEIDMVAKISSGKADVGIGWRSLHRIFKSAVDIIDPLAGDFFKVPRIGTLDIYKTNYSRNKKAADLVISRIMSIEGYRFFKKYGLLPKNYVVLKFGKAEIGGLLSL